MKISSIILVSTMLALPLAQGQTTGASYLNWLRQVQFPTGLQWDVPVAEQGQQLSPLAIDPGGARFELSTIHRSTLASHLLDTRYVSTYTPVAELLIVTEDPYTVIPRTRVDRPFQVVIQVNGLVEDNPDAPQPAREVRILRHVQSYGATGDADTIDRSQALLFADGTLEGNDTFYYDFPLSAIPGGDRTRVRGEERFSVFTLPHLQAGASQLASQFVQIWPIARASVTGVTSGETVRFNAPKVTINLEDLYPDSRTYAQIYKGAPALGTEGKVIPGSALVVYEPTPQDRTLVLENWDKLVDEDGQWTIEILTATPFGIDRLSNVSFSVDRSIEVQGTVTTLEE